MSEDEALPRVAPSNSCRALFADVLRITCDEWEAREPRVKEVDRELASACAKASELHDAIRCDDCMGVRSGDDIAEESGIESCTDAAKLAAESCALPRPTKSAGPDSGRLRQ